ncbi:MAG: CheR family methyltransferase [Flavisolibacter sp.]
MPNKNIKPVQIQSNNLFPVVGVGASAGGLETFKELVKAIPEDSGMSYIFIQHLSPNYESLLTDILQKLTQIPVLEITDNIKVLPNHIYVIPSNKLLTANDGVLLLGPRPTGEKLNTIDIFFTSLAEIHQDHAIGVILSGTGDDGTVGLKNIKDHGGITIVQDEKSAAYYGMPQSAIDAEVVDLILSPAEIPKQLQELIQSSRITPSEINDHEELKDENTFRQILTLLKARRGLDFTYYKQTTIRRRILRRKALNKINTLKEYQNYLLENKVELDALFNDILIPVTAFFRDPKTFTLLIEKVFPVMFKNKSPNEPIRIWVAGCSTGEEAYSIAISLHEYFGDKISERKIQIFATDISETVIAKARSGIYQKKDISGLSEQRIKEYFIKIDGSYQVNKSIRQICVFACQNFLKDPPFAKMDFISCRNVLIYLEPYLQKKALNTFHYALKTGGFLLLGKSETIAQASQHFNTFNQQNKIYTRKVANGKYMLVATESAEASLKRKDTDLAVKDLRRDDFQKAADDALLSKFASVGVIVNEQLDILQFRGITSAYLEAPPGKASHNILKMAREGLAFELRTALHKAKNRMEVVKKEGISIDKGKRRVSIEVIPLRNTIELYFLVLFEETIQLVEQVQGKRGKKLKNSGKASASQEFLRIEDLEKQLSQSREDMRTLTEEQEAANEELQSANEELLSGSEELQSLNEELETTKEEIQSTNEELTILNQELLERNEQLIHSRKYAEAVVSTIHEPLIILTKEFRIKSANKAFYEKFNLTEQQAEGKMFFELDNGKWNLPLLHEKLQKILPEGSFFEGFEIVMKNSTSDELMFELNARQLINENSYEQLILLAIQDITSQKKFSHELELQVRQRTKELKAVNTQLLQSNENLQQFASIASHDLQEPLRKIRTFTELLRLRFIGNLPEEGKEIVNKIKTSSDRMSQLIKEVLQYSKVANSNELFVTADLDLILKSVINDLDLVISDTNALITYNNNLPKVEAIPLQMNQLFYNLLTNALKFHNKTERPSIEISFKMLSAEEIMDYKTLTEGLNYIEIKFADNGIGFEQQFADQIFQIFERLHTPEYYEGTGVGLALCKKIVEIHHGHIFAMAEEKKGAAFHVLLPVKQ